MQTSYQSNSLGELQQTTSPDAGLTRYLYDKAGRVRFSQNAEQKARSIDQLCVFSYTKYDTETGRIVETGECSQGGFSGTQMKFDESEPGYGVVLNTFVENYDFPGLIPNAVLTDKNTYLYDTRTLPAPLVQDYLQRRVSAVKNESGSTHYSYDVHGRVKRLVQELPAPVGQKTIDYNYTLLTGQVSEVIYQKEKTDELHHHYTYDADNRLTNVEVSKNGIDKTPAAAYSYYTHGPLKNTVLGDQVQQTDYTYNLQGWLKAINHPIEGFDPGKNIAPKDVFAEVLNYFEGDYNKVGNGLDATAVVSPNANSNLKMVNAKDARNLYNGNIQGIVSYTGFDLAGQNVPSVQGIGYSYDQLNRLTDNYTSLHARGDLSSMTNEQLWNGGDKDKSPLREALSYDASGNITSLSRFREATPTKKPDLHELNYEYDKSLPVDKKANNKLLHVTGLPGQANFTPSNPNYKYDAKGRMVQDLSEDIGSYVLAGNQKGNILWTAYDKVKSIIRNIGSTKANVAYTYDAMGNRLSKAVNLPNNTKDDYTDNYVYDASGNVMAVYDKSGNLKEEYLYGVGRLGVLKPNATLRNEDLSFEITDHLGSVRAVISGKKKSAAEADISYLSDYYSNGVNSREYVTGAGRPRYLWQGMEWDMETKSYTTLFRFYSPEYGRWWSPDPVVQPWQSNYNAMDGNPIYYTDRLGLSKDGPGSGAKNTVKSKFGNAAGGGGRKPPGTNLQAKGIPRIAPNPGLRMASMVNSMNRAAVSAGKVLAGGAAGFANAIVTNQAGGLGRINKISDDPNVQAGYEAGQATGDLAGIVGGAVEFLLGVGGEALGGAAILSGNGTEGVLVAGASTMAIRHGAAVTVTSAYNLYMNVAGKNEETHPGNNGGELAKNVGNDAKKMSDKEIGEFLGEGSNWHKTAAKSKFLQKFRKQLKGDTNADFYVHPKTKEVLLKSNKSGNWISTGQTIN